ASSQSCDERERHATERRGRSCGNAALVSGRRQHITQTLGRVKLARAELSGEAVPCPALRKLQGLPGHHYFAGLPSRALHAVCSAAADSAPVPSLQRRTATTATHTYRMPRNNLCAAPRAQAERPWPA